MNVRMLLLKKETFVRREEYQMEGVLIHQVISSVSVEKGIWKFQSVMGPNSFVWVS